MKRTAVLLFSVTLVLFSVFSGCTGSQPAQQPVVTTVQATATPTPEPTATPDPYPNASALNTPAPFGAGTKTGEMSVTSYKVKPTFSWSDPSWNSPREQSEGQGSLLETQKGYNTKKPAEGNTFVFIYLTAEATGSEAFFAPAPSLIYLSYDGKNYPYTKLASAETVVDGEVSNEYDYELGPGGSGGYVKTGRSNMVKGFLIYEVPATFVPERTYVIINADAKNTGVWKLA